jgi:hypothetical protein
MTKITISMFRLTKQIVVMPTISSFLGCFGKEDPDKFTTLQKVRYN